MRKAQYRISVKEDSKAEAILSEIDNFFIELERKHPGLAVSIP